MVVEKIASNKMKQLLSLQSEVKRKRYISVQMGKGTTQLLYQEDQIQIVHLKELQQIHLANGANNHQLLKLQLMQQEVMVEK